MYYISVDGGGTKTAFGLLNEAGELIDKVILPTCHFLQVGYKRTAEILLEGINQLTTKHKLSKKDVKISLGIAGYGNDKSVRETLDYHISKVLHGFDYKLTNDMHIALLGALDGKDGISIVTGTGSIAMSLRNGQLERCGGWGYQLGDEGSAYWIGKQILHEFCKQSDGRAPKGMIYQEIMNHYELKSPYQIIGIVNSFENSRTEIAKLSYLCSTLADEGDVTCIEILQQAAKEVASLIKPLAKNFDTKPYIAYHGGVFSNAVFMSHITKELSCEGILVDPIHGALYGGYLFIK